MRAEELTLPAIDCMRHLSTSWDIVRAVAFAARAGHSDRTAYRFVTALVMIGKLEWPQYWPEILKAVMELEAVDAEETD